MKHFIITFFNFLLIVVLFVYAHELRGYTDSKHRASVEAIQRLNSMIIQQNKTIEAQAETIENYKDYVDNVGRCIIEGKW